MCKTRKKDKEIIINIFVSTEDMKKKNCDLAVSRTNEKKKTCREAGMGYFPFLVLGHDTIDFIVTQQGTGAHGQQRATTRRSSAATRSACMQGRLVRARAHLGHSVSRYEILYRGEGQQHSVATRQQRAQHDAAIWHLVGTTRRVAPVAWASVS